MAQKGLITQDLSKELVRGKQAAFQYKPLEDTQLAWLARTENQRNYLESERKAKEQRDLRDNLAKIEALGLPKEMQGYLNSNVDDLINKVRAGEIDPESYDFRRMVQTISGEANQLNNINNNLKKLAAEDKQVITFDESGAKDIAPELKNRYFDSYNKDYEKGTNPFDTFTGIYSGLESGTNAINFDPTKLDTALKNFLDRNKELSVEAAKFPGVTGLALIKKLTSVDPDAVKKWNAFVDEAYAVDIASSYAKDRITAGDEAVGSIDEYSKTRLDPWKIDEGERITSIETRTIPQPKIETTGTGVPSYKVEYFGVGDQKIKDKSFEQYPAFVAGDITVQGQPVVGVVNINGVEKAMVAKTRQEGQEEKTFIEYVDDSTLVAGYKNEILKKGNEDIRKATSDYLKEYEGAEKTIFDVGSEIDAIVTEAAKDTYNALLGAGDDEEAFQAFLESKDYELGDLDLDDYNFDDKEDMEKFAKKLLEKNDQLARQKPISTEQSNQEEKRTTITFNADGSMNSTTK
jgi:hypothetical protein